MQQVGQAFETAMMMDLGYRVLEQCWDVCYDSKFERKELTSGDISQKKLEQASTCQTRCITRHYEVMKLIMEFTEQRQKEQALGLAPGTLDSK